MGRKVMRGYTDPVETRIGMRNLTEDDIINAIDEKYKWIPSNVSNLIEQGFKLEQIKKILHIGDIQLIKALKEINKTVLAETIKNEKI